MSGVPPRQYLAPEFVIGEIGSQGRFKMFCQVWSRTLVLALLGGGFITLGALFTALPLRECPHLEDAF